MSAPGQPRGVGPLTALRCPPEAGRWSVRGDEVNEARVHELTGKRGHMVITALHVYYARPRPTSAPSQARCSVRRSIALKPAAELGWVCTSSEVCAPKRPRRRGPIRARWCVQFCVQFAPVLSVRSAMKVLVKVAGKTAMDGCGLGADIF
jgi:hypothetical protein